MALFGRRKPGFSDEVELKPSEIPGEFSDAIDPALHKLDNPKAEKIDMQKRAESVMAAMAAKEVGEAAIETDDTPNIIEYLETLPDVEDPFTPTEPSSEGNQADEAEEIKLPGQVLAAFVRERSRAAQLTPLSPLREEDEDIDKMLEQMRSLSDCEDIASIKGEKDEYLYASTIMATNYAMIAAFIEEKDLPRTIAEMVRFNCKLYPAPTPLYYFTRHPYSYTMPQIDRAVSEISRREEYADIKQLVTFNGITYLHSTQTMSERYAASLADSAERGEDD